MYDGARAYTRQTGRKSEDGETDRPDRQGGHGPFKVPFLGVLADEENELQIGQSGEHWLAPQFGAFTTWRQVTALGVKAGEAEAHGHDGDDLRIVENALTDAEPAAQADA